MFYPRLGFGKLVSLYYLMRLIWQFACLREFNGCPILRLSDIGPSNSRLILLLKDVLLADKKHLVAYHRLRMCQDYDGINDTQLAPGYSTR